jgi:hypothetical protein
MVERALVEPQPFLHGVENCPAARMEGPKLVGQAAAALSAAGAPARRGDRGRGAGPRGAPRRARWLALGELPQTVDPGERR